MELMTHERFCRDFGTQLGLARNCRGEVTRVYKYRLSQVCKFFDKTLTFERQSYVEAVSRGPRVAIARIRKPSRMNRIAWSSAVLSIGSLPPAERRCARGLHFGACSVAAKRGDVMAGMHQSAHGSYGGWYVSAAFAESE